MKLIHLLTGGEAGTIAIVVAALVAGIALGMPVDARAVACGDILSTSVTLDADLNCGASGAGLFVFATT